MWFSSLLLITHFFDNFLYDYDAFGSSFWIGFYNLFSLEPILSELILFMSELFQSCVEFWCGMAFLFYFLLPLQFR